MSSLVLRIVVATTILCAKLCVAGSSLLTLPATRIIFAVARCAASCPYRLSNAMSHLAFSDDSIPYQTPPPSATRRLAMLESACAPYLRAGYKIMNHSPDSFMLMRARAPVSIPAVLLLLAAPPLLILYLVVARNRRDAVACVRINSLGIIEESGDTLDTARARQRQLGVAVLAALGIVLTLGAFLWFIAANNSNSAATSSVANTPPLNADHPASTTLSSNYTNRSKRKDKTAAAYSPYVAGIPALPPAQLDHSSPTGTPDEIPSLPASNEHGAAPRRAARPEPLRMVNEGEVLFPAKPPGGTVYRRNEVDMPAELLARPEPVFTAEGTLTSGTVRLEAVCRPDRMVTDIRIVKGLPNGLTWAAVKAARGITFTPAMKDGKPVSMRVLLVYSFNSY